MHYTARLTAVALKVASVTLAIAVAAAAVYAADTLPRRSSVVKVHAAVATVTAAPLVAVIHASEAWSADESAAGMRPDASH